MCRCLNGGEFSVGVLNSFLRGVRPFVAGGVRLSVSSFTCLPSLWSPLISPSLEWWCQALLSRFVCLLSSASHAAPSITQSCLCHISSNSGGEGRAGKSGHNFRYLDMAETSCWGENHASVSTLFQKTSGWHCGAVSFFHQHQTLFSRGKWKPIFIIIVFFSNIF